MKKVLMFFAAVVMTVAAAAQVRVVTPNTELVLKAEQGGELLVQYFGDRLSDNDFANLEAAGVANHNAYPAYGFWCANEPALAVTHPDGNMSTVLRVEGVTQTVEDGAQMTRILLKDTIYPLYVTVCYKAYQDVFPFPIANH